MKTYKLSYDLGRWSATVQIDEEKAKDNIKEMVEFWSDYDIRLERNNNDYTLTFLNMLGVKLLSLSLDYGMEGIIYLFNEGVEGWCSLDGTDGIELLDVEEFNFEHDEISIEKVEERTGEKS